MSEETSSGAVKRHTQAVIVGVPPGADQIAIEIDISSVGHLLPVSVTCEGRPLAANWVEFSGFMYCTTGTLREQTQ